MDAKRYLYTHNKKKLITHKDVYLSYFICYLSQNGKIIVIKRNKLHNREEKTLDVCMVMLMMKQ